MQQLDRDEVSTLVDAPPDQVYALIADVTRTPEFSPEIRSCRWLDGATGAAVGARFEAVNATAAGRTWKNRPVVRVAAPGREFAFARTEPMAGTVVWRYRLEEQGGGTRVIESYEVERPVTRVGWFVIERIFRAGNRRTELRQGMETTLARLKAVAEAGAAASR
ncbi:SRPBCC family protein [Blastococcus saxobsidens]|uniref:Polyketide cyclase/dehydrase/lipid transport protein n=1 Tax=Blastococcus saxobsidens TaxID=138336 RepID=A0A4Q7YAX0_9ACTN|nr:SRPBCC family protein [Blastococcus saxobsidens]RZU34357.1 polyketide cyclase/dehydrase/lipid transport protein [Blastococcus saxobsidens]